MSRITFLKWLRICWTTMCEIACVLLVVLWVRSYFWADRIGYQQTWSQDFIESARGRISFNQSYCDTPILGGDFWYIESTRTTPGHGEFAQQFEWWEFNSDIHVTIPHWLPAVFLAALAALPWIRWLRHFSLR